jgi:hypothetical protein
MTERREHLDDGRIHDFLDGELDLAEERAVEAHVRDCEPCASRLAEVTAVVDALHGLPDRATPPRDLWSDIESRIRGGAKVLSFPESGDAVGRAPGGIRGVDSPATSRREVSFTMPQLWAAGIAVALLSGAAVWFALGGGGAAVPGASVAAAPGEAAGIEAPDVRSRARVRTASDAYEQAVIDLEAILESGREFLDPGTVRIIEESLASIDEAIAEAEGALARDPGSELLHSILLQHQRTKLRILRQAASGVGART